MAKYQEVEVRYPLLNLEIVLQEIDKLQLEKRKDNEIQSDSYYTPFHKNFLEQNIVSEWFRIRETAHKCSMNFKQWLPIGAEIQNQCNEYETIIEDAFAVKKTLDLLDFRKIIIVNKKRNSWVCDDVEISIDSVENLGDFIELEAIKEISDEQIDLMHQKFDILLNRIHAKVGERDHRGYPYLLIEKKRQGDQL